MQPVWHFVNGVPQIGPLTIGASAVTSTVPVRVADAASSAAPSLAASGDPTTGISFVGSTIRTAISGTYYLGLFPDQFQLKSTSSLDWSSNTIGAASDVSLSRGAAKRVDVTNSIRLIGATFANLPTAAVGAMAWVTDSSTATWGATIAGSGANGVLAVYNGTNWTVVGA